MQLGMIGLGRMGGNMVLHEQGRLVAASWVEKFNAYRLTLTPPVLHNAACAMFLISGAEKAETLWTVVQGDS